ncbi:MAG: Peptidoglycan-binding lysin domain protein [Herbinix sp.]|jgi:spore germination protein|nr:Peptidoglycan-binding lysin domain protein [Herbinix sp.]
MIIHVVQPGDTIDSVAIKYETSIDRLIIDNGILNPENLVVGQTIAIVQPEQTHIVQDGDTLLSIAQLYKVPVMQLLRNNPFLSNREYIYPGETIIISYNEYIDSITTNGYAYPFINMDILKKSLPYLTYLTVFNYRASAEGTVVSLGDDTEIIRVAKEYGVAPILLLTTLSGRGESGMDIGLEILFNEVYQDIHIESILRTLKSKGYYGAHISFQYINRDFVQLYVNMLNKLANRLHEEGYPVFVTINPRLQIDVNRLTFEKVDYSGIGQEADGVTLMTYDWGYTYGPPVPLSMYLASDYLNHVINYIPPEKISIGLSIIAYDWQLPYNIGVTRARALCMDTAITLAALMGEEILFDEASQSPYFMYTETQSGIPIQHIVWFKDARSIVAIMNLIPENGFRGVDIWNIMQYCAQMLYVINTQYRIEKIYPEV